MDYSDTLYIHLAYFIFHGCLCFWQTGKVLQMKIAMINTVCNGSTGKIMGALQKSAIDTGDEALSFYGRRRGYKDMPSKKCGNNVSFWIHVIINTLFDRQGSGSYFPTIKLIKKLKNFEPDIIHLHNIHGYYLNFKLLFRFLSKEYNGQVVWTFHDCWPITGHCPYFTIVKCYRWKEKCEKCPQKNMYPISYGLDSSSRNYKEKKELFNSIKNLTIVCPSEWMKKNVEASFMRSFPCKVIGNGIDLNVFSPKKKLESLNGVSLSEKKIILCVAAIWEPRKGLDIICEIAKELSEQYKIIIVGLSDGQIKKIPDNILGITRTENMHQLAQLYSTADIFLNPSREESFSLVTIEAMACGTPVIAIDTSAVGELINDKNGKMIKEYTKQAFLSAIYDMADRKFVAEEVRKTVKQYSDDNMSKSYLELYYGIDNDRIEYD